MYYKFLYYFGMALVMAMLSSCSLSELFCGNSKDDEYVIRHRISTDAVNSFLAADVDALESQAEYYLVHRERTPSGWWKLTVFHEALNDQMTFDIPISSQYIINAHDSCTTAHAIEVKHWHDFDREWAFYEETIKKWMHKYPNSAVAKVSYAHLLVQHAWFYRGGCFAKTVPDYSWKPFFYYTGLASNFLITNKAHSVQDPDWYRVMLHVLNDVGNKDKEIQMVENDLLASKTNYFPAYQEAAYYRLPKWGGDYKQLDDWALASAQSMNEDDGSILYSRIYWGMWSFGERLADNNYINWSLFYKGNEANLRHNNDSWNLNYLARILCESNKKEETRQMMLRIGRKVIPEAWRKGQYVTCREWSSQ